MPLSHAWGKLFQAVTALVYDGDVRARLSAASRYVLEIDRDGTGIDDESWNRRFERLQGTLMATTLPELPTDRAEWLAEEILSLFIDVDAKRAEEQCFLRLIEDPASGSTPAA